MSIKNNGGPAFPVPNLEFDSEFNGMTLRDYFAAKAMTVLMQNEHSTFKDDAQYAYEVADVMLKARETK